MDVHQYKSVIDVMLITMGDEYGKVQFYRKSNTKGVKDYYSKVYNNSSHQDLLVEANESIQAFNNFNHIFLEDFDTKKENGILIVQMYLGV